IIYKGKTRVTNGDFKFTFIVPKDIAYNFGNGRISYYSQNGTTDANGFYEDFIIGGTSNDSITDGQGPELKIFMNDVRFVSGGITDKNPVLLLFLNDSAGVNTIGNGIGHDIAAVLDENTDKTFVLNDYYESDMDTYQSGVVRYPFSNLENGEHKLRVKAWDVYNNSAESEIDFVVAESAELALNHVLNYPNPFTTYTEFWFEHNQPCCALDVQIQIFTITGKIIKSIQTTVETNGYRADPIPWDGRDDFGDVIGKGVYVYMLKVKNSTGQISQKTEKLVILK
ncbi:MAG TPA: T9SS type A sorting domain-containing protein, partial [Bacteroidales bacterium]|nr:T9SS type A sorting domain-containing protein [Bacteroidales bacterium]